MSTIENKPEFCDTFFEMETKEDLFPHEVEGIPIWDSIRSRVGSRLIRQYGLSKEAHDSNWRSRSTLNTGVSIAKSLTTHNPLLATEKDLLVVGTSRRKLVDNEWTDIHLDYFLEEVDQDYVYLDRPYQLTHFRPTRTENITYTDVFEYPIGVLRMLGKRYYSTTTSHSEICECINNKIKSYFDQAVAVDDLIYDEIILEKTLKRAYVRVLKRVDPDAVLLTIGYDTRRLLIRACNELSIPVIEYQHGVITPYHLGYSYPSNFDNITYPDYLFTWGEFWSKNFHPPISSDRIFSVGYPHFNQNTAKFNKEQRGSGTLFISQGTIGKELSRFAVAYASENPSENVIYKLHPGEYKRWKSEYPWLTKSNITVVDDDNRPIYELFEECSIQVGVNSTALFEGLAFNMSTYIYQIDGCEIMGKIIDARYAELVKDTNDIIDHGPSKNRSTTDFFSKSPYRNFQKYLSMIML